MLVMSVWWDVMRKALRGGIFNSYIRNTFCSSVAWVEGVFFPSITFVSFHVGAQDSINSG